MRRRRRQDWSPVSSEPEKVELTESGSPEDTDLRAMLARTRKEYDKYQAARDKEHAEFMSEWEKRNQLAQKVMFPHLREATAQDYKDWLAGYLRNGGRPTHFSDSPVSCRNDFYVATSDFHLVPLYGAAAIKIIVPAGIRVRLLDASESFGGYGHNELYYVDGFRPHSHSVRVFSDTTF